MQIYFFDSLWLKPVVMNLRIKLIYYYAIALKIKIQVLGIAKVICQFLSFVWIIIQYAFYEWDFQSLYVTFKVNWVHSAILMLCIITVYAILGGLPSHSKLVIISFTSLTTWGGTWITFARYSEGGMANIQITVIVPLIDSFLHFHVASRVFTRGQYWPSGIVVACVCPSVRQSVRHQVCPRDNSSPIQARITKFGP